MNERDAIPSASSFRLPLHPYTRRVSLAFPRFRLLLFQGRRTPVLLKSAGPNTAAARKGIVLWTWFTS